METTKQRKYGVDTYSKWDKFEEEDEEQTKNDDVKLSEAMQFSLGAVDIDIKDVNYLPDEKDLIKRYKNLPQRESEVWQVVVRKLRVWAASSTSSAENTSACRPYCVFVSCIYPDGKLLSQDLAATPEVPPTPQSIVNLLMRIMLNPTNGGTQRRPGKLTFVQPELVGELFKTFKAINIEVSQLSEAEGVDNIVKAFSEQLIKRDIARSSEVSENPGLLSGEQMTSEIGGNLHEAAVRLAKVEPWKYISERESFELMIPVEKQTIAVQNKASGITIPPATVWVSIIGNDCIESGKIENGTFGVAVFFSRLDLETRVSPPGHEVYREELEPRCSYTGKTANEIGHELKRTKPRRFDIRTGREIQYADNEALKAHWPKVKKFVRPLSELEKGLKEKRENWMPLECTVLFENPTVIPFDDHDAVDQFNWKTVDPSTCSLGENSFPLFLELQNGVPARPGVLTAVWLERAMNAIVRLLENNEVKKQVKSGLLKSKQEVEIEIDSTIIGESEKILVRGSPVFVVAEVEAAKRRAEERQRNVEASGHGGEEINTSEMKQQPEKEEGGCTVA